MNRKERIDDELLVLRCQDGDEAAFAELVDRWQERLWRHAWRLTGREDVAWDVLQEAWIGMARSLNRLQDVAAFPAWAYQIVSHKCRDWIRRERSRRRAHEAYSRGIQEASEQAVVAEQQRAGLREALDHLSGQDRAVLWLRYQEQFSTADIAEILGIPEGTVKSRLHHARNRLRKHLEQINDESARR